MKNLIMLAGLLFSPAALADGFVCEAKQDGLRIQVYNYTARSEGTRRAAVMILSDPSRPRGHQTLATFTHSAGDLRSQGSNFVAVVAAGGAGAGNQIIGETTLGELSQMNLAVDFSYARPVANGEDLEGTLTLVTKTGHLIDLDLECFRYIKGE